jgi:hypothetical protein
MIDDFIYITPSQDDAKQFLKVMAEGSKEYGCFISVEKTLINFKYGGVNQVVGNGKFAFFPFVQTSNETVLTLIYI